MNKQWKLLLGSNHTLFVVLFSLTILLSGCGGGHWDLYSGGGNSNSDSSAPVSEYSISGSITLNGAALAGATVTLSGASSATTTTDANGNYSFTGLSNGSYTITPTLIGYNFSNTSDAVTINGASVTVSTEIATSSSSSTYSISGTVTSGGAPLSGVTITLSGTSSGTATTDTNGDYSFTGLADGSYTVTPSLAGYTFTSPIDVTLNGADSASNNFVATSTTNPTYFISGTVSTSSGVLSGVTMTLSGTNGTTATVTDSNGDYTFTGLDNGSYTLTPSLAGYTFTPAIQTVIINGANSTINNFTATANP